MFEAIDGLDALPVVDLSAPAFWQAPARALAGPREAGPLARTTRGEIVVLRYHAMESLLADDRLETIGSRLLEATGIDSGPLADWWRLVMFNTNPPEHGHLRSLVSRAFTPRRTEALRASVRALADSLVVRAVARQDVDYDELVASVLPIQVTCALLGVPESEWTRVARWADEIGQVFATRISVETRKAAEDAVRGLTAMFDDLFVQRTKSPRDDLLSAMQSAGDKSAGLSREERNAMAINLVFAGHDTTRGLLSVGLFELLRAPQALEAVRNDADLVPGAIEEMLRLEPPTLGSLRAPSQALEFEGVTLPIGRPLHFFFAGANRDPRVFDAPDRFDPKRSGPRHLSFGLGSHFCLGAGLARLEAQETLRALLALTSEIEVMSEPTPRPFATIRRFDAGLRLRLRT